jgi:DnaJ-class molecular chaperone
MINYYEILGLPKTASSDDIKQSYRKLARENHPDKGGSTEVFQNIQSAYEVLSDDNKRREYDMQQEFGGVGPPPPFPGGFPFPAGFPFNMFFNQQQNQKPPDTVYTCKLSLKDVYTGTTRKFNVKRKCTCFTCNKPCANCNGTGIIAGAQNIRINNIVQFFNQPCNKCQGNGTIREKDAKCEICNSVGFIEREKFIELVIPRGVENKKQYRYEEWGEQNTKPNDKPSDFVIVIDIEDDDNFRRNGYNLYYTTDISLVESIIGKNLLIPYFDQPIEVNSKEFGIINPNKEYIIIDKGLCSENGEIKGDMYIKFNIKYPERVLENDEIDIIRTSFLKIKL